MFGWIDKMNRNPAEAEEPVTAPEGILITGRAGFLGAMHVATSLGWRQTAALSVGDRVLTFDHGLQPVLDIQRETLATPDGRLPEVHWPVLVPEGALDNGAPIWLMPDQGLLVESDTIADILDDPFAVIPAQALVGFRGIRRELPQDDIAVSTVAFAQDEVVYVEGGLLAHCPRPRNFLDEAAGAPDYAVLQQKAARHLVRCLIEDDDIRALICDHEEIVGITARGRPHLHSVPGA